jgi:hypothetical protein
VILGLRQYIALILAALLDWISSLDLLLTAEGRDPTWELVLGHFLRHKFQAGIDYIFAYGPLGYVLTTSYHPALYWLKYGWEVAIKLLFVVILWKISESFPKFRDRLFFFLLAAVLSLLLPPVPDAIYVFFLFAGSIYLPGTVFGVLCGLLALTKFTFLMIAVALIALVTIDRRSLSALISFVGAFLAGWLILGQGVDNIPRYLSTAWQITSGYGDAMSLTGPTKELVLALIVVLLLAFASLRSRYVIVLALGLTGFLLFKHAFVRQDIYHTGGFFVFAAFAFMLLRRSWQQKAGIALSFTGLLMCQSAISIPMLLSRWKGEAIALIRPLTLHHQLDRQYLQLEKRFALPRLREVIGTGSVDVRGDQRMALFNNLTWRPRPIFQTYCAYTPKLLSANAAFFEGTRAPNFILASWEERDTRLPSADDGAALLKMLAQYEPVTGEADYYLFRRTKDSRLPSPAIAREINIGQSIEIAPSQTATFEIEYSLIGKLRNFLYRPAPILLHLTLASGEVKTYKGAPSIIGSEFLLSPLFQSLNDVVNFASTGTGRAVQSVEIDANPHWFKRKIRVTLREFALAPIR